MLTFQAYYDDSGNKGQGRWMAMAGLFGEAGAIAYLQLFQYVPTTSISEAVEHGAQKPIEIVFDQHDKFRPVIAAGYNELRESEKDYPALLRMVRMQILPGHCVHG